MSVGRPPSQAGSDQPSEMAVMTATALGPNSSLEGQVLHAVLDSLVDGVVVIDAQGKFVLFNPTAERILGLDLAAANYERWAEHCVSYRPDGVTPYLPEQLPLARARRGEEVIEAEELMVTRQRPEGTWLTVNARPIRDTFGRLKGAIAIFRDITERKRVERREAVQHEVTRILAEAANTSEAAAQVIETLCRTQGWEAGFFWEVDLHDQMLHCIGLWYADRPELKALAEWSRRYAIPPETDVPGEAWSRGGPWAVSELRSLGDLPRPRLARGAGLGSALAVPILIGNECAGVIEFYTRSGRSSASDALLLLDLLGSQLSEFLARRRSEKALLDSEALYHSLVDTLPINILRKDLAGRFTFGNKQFRETLGPAAEDFIGKTDYDLYPAELAEKYSADDRKVIATGKVFEDIEEHRTAEGKRIFVQVIKAPVYDAKGAIVGVQVIFWDVTDRKLAEERLRLTAEELARSNRELEQFAYIASHDLREPLRMVSSFCQLLQRRYAGRLDAEADEFIAFAVDGAQRMQRMIDDLLAYSRVETRGKPFQETDCQAVLDQVLAHLRLAIEESGATITHDPLPVIRSDPTQLVQLFQNLIGNAIKFRSQEPPVIHVGAKPTEGGWHFTVRDNGLGIAPADHERIFAVFHRLHGRDEYSGTGIGLAVCRRIVERHGGTIWVESELGRGATFHFTLKQQEVESE